MNWLAIDTAGAVSTVAITKDRTVLAEISVLRNKRHSEQLVYHMDTALTLAGLSKNDISAIAVSVGPGSFTGLRIGLATAKALAFAWRVPIVGVNTLTSLVYGYRPAEAIVCAMMDAQKNQVYYSLGKWIENRFEFWAHSRIGHIDEVLDEIASAAEPVVCIGEGAALFAEKIKAHKYAQIAPAYNISARAATVAAVAREIYEDGGGDDLFELVPNYLRKSEAEILWERRQCRK